MEGEKCMEHAQTIFKRYEVKYLLDEVQYKRMREALADHMEMDRYGQSRIYNIYFDTPDFI